MTDKDSMVLYGSVYRQFQLLLKRNKNQEALEYIKAIMEYGFEGIEPHEDSDVWLYGFESSKISIDNAAVRYIKAKENGNRGGRPRINLEKEEVLKKKEELNSWAAVAKYFNVSENTLYKIRKEWEETSKTSKTQKPISSKTQELFEENQINSQKPQKLKNLNVNVNEKDNKKDTMAPSNYDYLYDQILADGYIEALDTWIDNLDKNFFTYSRADQLSFLQNRLSFSEEESIFILNNILECAL